MQDNWESEVAETSYSVKSREENSGFDEKPKRPSGRGRPIFNRPTEINKPGLLDLNNNELSEKQSFGFAKINSFDDTRNSELNEEKSKPIETANIGFGLDQPIEENEENWDGFDKGPQKLESNERKEFGAFNRRTNRSEESETKSFRKFDNDRGQNGFGDGERRGFGSRDGQNFSRRNEENRGFNRRNDNQGEERKFRRNNDDGEDNRGFNKGFGSKDRNENGSFRNRDRSFGDGEKRSFNKNFGNRDNNENGDRKGFSFNRRSGENDDGEKRAFNRFNDKNREQRDEPRSFNRRNNQYGDENKKGFGQGFGSKDRNENGENRSFRNRDRSSGDGERGQFRKRDDQNGKDDDVAKKEKYIPTDVEETEETLFTTVAAGVNFKKQIEIKTDLSGNGSEDIKPLSSFDEAGFSDLLLDNIKKTKYTVPTSVQQYSIPIILKRRDLMACAQTGSGKTAAFVLPILKNILEDGIESSQLSGIQQPQALILSPTRELALQILHECKKFSHGSIIQTQILYGGVFFGYQLSKVEKGCNILVATPGRLLHFLESKNISLEKVKYFVLDEADRMLDMGFEKSIREILEKGKVREKNDHCTFMFSATFPDEIQRLAQQYLKDYLFLAVGQVGGANTDVEQSIYKVTRFEKREKCIEILDQIGNERTMIFVEHKKEADVNAFFLIQKGYPATSIHGDRMQSQRELALREFKNGSKNILVCTAVAARGLDIEKVNHVINFDLPSSIDEYVHRIGRTGRCGNLGKSISFFDPENENDQKLARPLVRILSQAGQTVPEWLTSFSEHSVPSSTSINDQATDLRSKFDRVKIDTKISAFSNTHAENEEESWD